MICREVGCRGEPDRGQSGVQVWEELTSDCTVPFCGVVHYRRGLGRRGAQVVTENTDPIETVLNPRYPRGPRSLLSAGGQSTPARCSKFWSLVAT